MAEKVVAVGLQHAGPRWGYNHKLHPWCQPGDLPERRWMLVFDDTDQRTQYFNGEGAEDRARIAYGQYSPTWNCTLYSAAEFRESPKADIVILDDLCEPDTPERRAKVAHWFSPGEDDNGFDRSELPLDEHGAAVGYCPKCKSTSGNSWGECGGHCPMKGSPDYDEETAKYYDGET